MSAGAGEMKQIILDALKTQSPIDRDTLYDHICDVLDVRRDTTLNRGIGVALSWMRRDGVITETKDEVFLVTTAPTPEKKSPTTKRFVQANPQGERVQISTFMAKRNPRSVSLESSPLLVEDVLKVEFQIGTQWFEIDSEGGLRICIGDEKPAWSPDEQTNTGVSCIRLTLRTGYIQEYGHNPNTPITTLKLR